jgi:hypothetical protein
MLMMPFPAFVAHAAVAAADAATASAHAVIFLHRMLLLVLKLLAH